MEFGIAVEIFFVDAAKKSFSSFSHVMVVMPIFKQTKFLDSYLHFFGSLRISLELRIIWFREKGRQSQACKR
jgi:hypothetical protein